MIWRYRRRVDTENRRKEDSWSWLSNTIAWVQDTPAPYDPRDVTTTTTTTTSTTSIASTTLTSTGTVGSDTNLPSNFASVAPHSHLRFQQSYSILQSRPPSEDGSHESECFSFITAAGSQTSLITFSTAGSMWEDNNPLSYDRRSSTSSFRAAGDDSPDAGSDIEPPDFLTRPPRTPPETSGDEAGSRHSDEDEDEDEQYQRRDQGYNSRVEQTLLEHRDLPIVITDAGKNSEGSGGFIVYTIRTGVCFPPIFPSPLPVLRLSGIRRNSRE